MTPDISTPDVSAVAFTYTNAVVQIIPNWASLSVAETVTATVTTISFYTIAGGTTPLPSGAGTPVGAVVFNLNNQLQAATLDANGQATATFHLPLVAVLASQQLTAAYQGTPLILGVSGPIPVYYYGSTFETPLYMNSTNLFLPATLTFGQLTPQQLTTTYAYINTLQQASLPSFNSAQGEMDNLGWFAFHYIDPGIIDSVILPGFFAFEMGAYNGFFPSSLSNASSN